MVQFNLLPDVKIQYLKAKRQEHLVILISTIATIAGIMLVVLLLSTVYVVQKKNLSDLNRDIKTNSDQLKSTQSLNKILTVQNQLKSLPALHDKKPVATRMATFLSQITPSAVSISKLTIDYSLHTIIINGNTDTLDTVNTFADTLKFTTYTVKKSGVSGQHAFSKVVLTNFSRDKKGATYTLTTSFDPVIFSEASDVSLTVPNIISTRSAVEQPTALFQNSNTSGQ